MNAKMARIKAMLLAGAGREEIFAAGLGLASSSVPKYIQRCRADHCTPAERDQIDKAKSKQPVVIKNRAFVDQKPLSIELSRIGRRLFVARQKLKLSYKEFSLRFNFGNQISLAAMEQGFHNLSVLELVQIAKILEITPAELLDPQTGVYPEWSSKRETSSTSSISTTDYLRLPGPST